MKKALRAVAVAVAVCAGAAGCNNDALPPAAGYASISGSIVDVAGNKPVAGALITIDTVLTATTDAGGKFSIDKVPSGIVDYTVQAQGYKLFTATTNIEPGKPFELDVTLAANTAPPH